MHSPPCWSKCLWFSLLHRSQKEMQGRMSWSAFSLQWKCIWAFQTPKVTKYKKWFSNYVSYTAAFWEETNIYIIIHWKIIQKLIHIYINSNIVTGSITKCHWWSNLSWIIYFHKTQETNSVCLQKMQQISCLQKTQGQTNISYNDCLEQELYHSIPAFSEEFFCYLIIVDPVTSIPVGSKTNGLVIWGIYTLPQRHTACALSKREKTVLIK